jgi:hypothetical protein
LALLVAALLALTACGGSGGGGGAGGGGDDGGSDLPDRADASSEDAEGTTYALQEGRYRLSYRAPDCEDVTISIQSVDGAFSFEESPRAFTSFVNDVVAGEYAIGVVSDCDEWTVTLVKF